MRDSRSMRLVESALRCYPKRWRSRHGDEAAEIAALLIQDGTPAWSVAWSYLMGAARTRLVTGPRRRLGAAAGALLLAAGSLGVPLALLSSPAPASAASVSHSGTAGSRSGSRSGHAGTARSRTGRSAAGHAGTARSRTGRSATGQSRTAQPRPAELWANGFRPAGPRYGAGRGAPEFCGRLDHC